jgi:hypothetical protein
VSLAQASNFPPVSLTPVPNLPLVSSTPAVLVAKFDTGVVDTCVVHTWTYDYLSDFLNKFEMALTLF